MKSRSYSLFPITVLGLLAALTFWLDRATHFEGGRRDGKNRHDPDFVVEQLSAKRYGADGRLLNLLTAEQMRHFPDDDTTLVHAPSLIYMGNQGSPLKVRARSATLSADGEVAELRDEVLGWRDATADSPATSFSTSRLTVYKDQEIAHTDAPVMIRRGKSELSGVGMDLDNKLALFQLRSQVKATIQPRKR